MDRGYEPTRKRARAALDRHDDLRSRRPVRVPRKAEDTSAGCLEMAENDRTRALENGNERMRLVLERSADAWETRGNMFKRLEASRERQHNGQGTKTVEQGATQAEGGEA